MQDMLPRLEPPSASEADVFAALVGGGGAVLAAPEFEQLLAEKNQMLLLFGPPDSRSRFQHWYRAYILWQR
jgi:hypothetical protein